MINPLPDSLQDRLQDSISICRDIHPCKIHADALASLTLAGPAVFLKGNSTAMGNPYRRRRPRLTEARRQHIIEEKEKLQERWDNDREGMLRRSHGGGRMTSKLYADRRDAVVKWLEVMPVRMTKEDLIREFEMRMEGGRDVKARSLIEKMRLYGKLRYDEKTGLWNNMTKQ